MKTKRKKILAIGLATCLLLVAMPAVAYAATANPTTSIVIINGQNISFDAYNIEGSNYFKLRDIAYALSGTAKQFAAGWDGGKNMISITSGQPYEAVGGEMAGKGTVSMNAVPTASKIYVNGNEAQLTAYNINGNNYFKLRDIGEALDFGVDWDGGKNTIVIDTSKGYSLDGGAVTPSPVPAATEPVAALGDANPDEWARTVFDESLQKLADEGALAYQPDYLFQFTWQDSAGAVPFLNDEAITQYVRTPITAVGKVILCYLDRSGKFNVYNKSDSKAQKIDNSDKQVPYYLPVLSDGSPVLKGVDTARFANSVSECDTLIVYGGFESSRFRDYYGQGWDRVGITTLVFVIDAKDKKILHVETIGTDTPGVRTEDSHTTGYTLYDLADKYVIGLLSK